LKVVSVSREVHISIDDLNNFQCSMLLVSELKNTSVRKGNILSIYHPFLNTIIIRPPVPHEEQEYHDADNAGLPIIGLLCGLMCS
jgi:hypothetical protein